MLYTKRFTHGETPAYIANEYELQCEAAYYGLAPDVIRTDYRTYIQMEDLDALNVADMYGEEIPKEILEKIYTIVRFLYDTCDIEYLDLTPYNFIEKNGLVYVVDFGDARPRQPVLDPYLAEIFQAGCITHWNPAFL